MRIRHALELISSKVESVSAVGQYHAMLSHELIELISSKVESVSAVGQYHAMLSHELIVK